MTTKKKQGNGLNEAVTGSLAMINNLWQNVEGEVDKALKTARQQGKKSAQTLKKTVDGLMTNMGVDDIRRRAMRTGDEFRKEVRKEFRKLSQEVRNQIKTVETVIEDSKLEDVVDRIKDNLSTTMNRIQDWEVMEYARVKMLDTREQMLSALQIPSNTDLEHLTRKVSVLEKRLNALKRHEARQ